MEFLFLPLVIGVMALPAPSPSAARLTDFTRLRDLAREEVYVIDTSGQERRLTILDLVTPRSPFWSDSSRSK
jgi:hypothetical protein